MRKKAQGISINTIIIAAIALAVLVVLFFIFTGRFKLFSEGIREGGLTCDRSCKALGHVSGFTRPACGTDEPEVPGRFEDTTTQNTRCCCIPSR